MLLVVCGAIKDPRLGPYFHKVVSRIKYIDMRVIRSFTANTFFIHRSYFFKDVNSYRAVIVGVEKPVLIINFATNLCKIVPPIAKRMSPTL